MSADKKAKPVICGVLAGVILATALMAAPGVAIGEEAQATEADIAAKCKELAEAMANAMSSGMQREMDGLGQYDPSKTFQAGNDCLKLIKAVNIDMSIGIIDMTGWSTVLITMADQLIEQLKQAACNIASNAINDVIGRYNKIITGMTAGNVLGGAASYWSSSMTTAVSGLQKSTLDSITQQASQWKASTTVPSSSSTSAAVTSAVNAAASSLTSPTTSTVSTLVSTTPTSSTQTTQTTQTTGTSTAATSSSATPSTTTSGAQSSVPTIQW